MALRPLNDAIRVHRAGLTCHLRAAAKEGQGRDAADAQASGKALGLLGIDLDQTRRWLQTGRRRLEGRRHHPTGRAPGGPEIDQKGQVTARHMPGEARLVERERPPIEQGLMTLATLGTRAQTSPRDPIHCIACGADDMEIF